MKYFIFTVAVIISATLIWQTHTDKKTLPSLVTKHVAGVINGLQGTLTVKVNNKQLLLSNADSYQYNIKLATDQALSLEILKQPGGQECLLARSDTLYNNDTAHIDIDCYTYPGSVAGLVSNHYTGKAIANADVHLMEEGEFVRHVKSNQKGEYSIVGIGVNKHFSISVQAENYARRTGIFYNEARNASIIKDLNLLPAQASQSLQSHQPTSIYINKEEVLVIDARHLEREDGKKIDSPVTAVLTVIDPPQDTNIIPGGLVNSNQKMGNSASTEFHGAISVNLFDNSGAMVNLAKGQQATISIPLASKYTVEQAPLVIPLWYFDENRGYWIEEGFAYLTENQQGGHVYSGKVKHFTTWNVGQIFDRENTK